MIAVLILLLVWLTGCALLRWMFPAPLRWSLHNVFLCSLGAGVGIGIASCLYFLCLGTMGPNVVVIALVEGLAMAGILAFAILSKRSGPEFEWAPGPEVPKYMAGLFLLAAAIGVTVFVVYAMNKPHGEWDAWAIWNLRARFFVRGGQFWKDAFTSQLAWSHPDYPLLLPGIVAMLWTLAHTESTAAPIGVAFLFALGTAGILTSTLGILRGKAQAFIGGILLIGTVSFTENAANQYADIPMSFAIIASLALICLQDRHPEDLRFSVLAGLTAGFAAWTKNEGVMFLGVLVVARIVAMVRYGNRSSMLPQLLRFAAGSLPPLAVVAFFKLRFAPANDLMGRSMHDIVAHATDFGRWVTTIEGFIKAAFVVGGFLIPLALLMAAYWFLVRFNVEARDRLSLGTLVITLGLMLIGDFAVYVLLAGDVAWQMNTSMERLFLQLWPSGILAFFLAANPPQLVATRDISEKSKPVKRNPKAPRRASQ
jgi:hypothetical protein